MPELVDVKCVHALDDYRLLLQFEDGAEGIFDVSPYLSKGVFSSLKDKSVFDSVFIEGGTVAWPGGIDIAPERLYAGMVEEQPF